MALQRTRGLVAAQALRFAGRGSAVQPLPGGRSPLNAVALGGPAWQEEEMEVPVVNGRRARSLVSIYLFVANVAFAGQPSGGKPAYFGFAFSFKKEEPEMRLGVCAVPAGTPAAVAGVQLDDLITAVDGKNSFKNALEVLDYLSQRKAGDELRLDLIRKDQKLAIRVVAAEATEQQQARMKRNLELAKQEAEQDRDEK